MQRKIRDRLDDVLFSICTRIPEKLIPPFLMKHINDYAHRRVTELQQDITRRKWELVQAHQKLDEIKKEAQQD